MNVLTHFSEWLKNCLLNKWHDKAVSLGDGITTVVGEWSSKQMLRLKDVGGNDEINHSHRGVTY